ncbi:hypothetical protein EDD86DRAFT_210194 [Gorgonomyces haynaldii]|nr:hypothetical protein EDD86DRAFT_210194 [Gorgonomyces haynaldii]
MEPILSHDEFEKIKERLNEGAEVNHGISIAAGVCAFVVILIFIVMMISSSGGGFNVGIFIPVIIVVIMLAVCGALVQKGQEREVSSRVQELNKQYLDRNIVFEEEAILSHIVTHKNHSTSYYNRLIHIYVTVAISPAQLASNLMYPQQMQSQMMMNIQPQFMQPFPLVPQQQMVPSEQQLMQPLPPLPQQQLAPSQPLYPPTGYPPSGYPQQQHTPTAQLQQQYPPPAYSPQQPPPTAQPSGSQVPGSAVGSVAASAPEIVDQPPK